MACLLPPDFHPVAISAYMEWMAERMTDIQLTYYVHLVNPGAVEWLQCVLQLGRG